ncbi:MAG: S-layer homology domain-containing protein [Clostridia bacterium]|nr:S-layer homology domain-containing protein [Clostridia bacterium]
MTIADNTAPTIVSIDTCASAETNFYPGDVIPIVVTFSEPVYGDYQLVYQEGAERAYLSSNSGVDITSSYVTRSGNILSNTRVFYYTVKSIDSTVPTGEEDPSFLVLGVKPTDKSKCTDVYGNNLMTAEDGTYKEYSAELLKNRILGGQLKQSFVSMSATQDAQDPCTFNIQVELDQDFAQKWSVWENDPAATVRVDNDAANPVNLTLSEAGTGSTRRLVLTGSVTLDDVSAATDHVAELYFDGSLIYGVYGTFNQYPVTKAGTDAYSISIDGSWPSGVENTIFVQDEEAPKLGFTDTNGYYTYKYLGTDDVTWTVSDPNVITLMPAGSGTDLTLTQSPEVYIIANNPGTATITLVCGNNGTGETTASNTITVTVKDSGRPALLFPMGANTVFARIKTDQTVHFASNISQFAPENGVITAELYTGSRVAENAAPIWTTTLDRTATSLTIPGELLTSISAGDTPSYILRLTATAEVDGTDLNLKTEAKIVVRAQPAVITLFGLDNPMFTDEQSIEIKWMVENFDLANNADSCQFQFTIEKDGEVVDTTEEKSEVGSYILNPEKPTQLKDYYVVTAKAKNGADPTWSIASSTITVYQTGALDILLGGEAKDSVTLKNEISGGTTTNPSINTYGDENVIDGLTNTQAIAKLRSELSLMESISINYQQYDWSLLNDTIKWSTSTGVGNEAAGEIQQAVTINYRQGMLYAPLENYSYTSYLPQTILLLCGLRDGSGTVTAQHSSIPSLNDSVTVNVETLKNKLYLFQFTPAVQTEVSYEDGLGELHTVYTNKDGSLALFEPNGIASDLWAASVSGGDSYRGTISQLALKSGEGNGTRGELYPLNALELRRAAMAQIQLLKPDGEPLDENTEVTVRGGVYRNRYAAENRDDAYCSNARFAKAAGEPASLDGTVDQTFTTTEGGWLTIHMDLSQFTTANNPDPVGADESLEFIFELRFGDSYYPEIVTVNGSLTPRDAMRTAADIVTLTAAQKAKPFVALQTISYTGREIDVRNYNGVVGPSSNYPSAVLDSTVMLWGMNNVSLTDTGSYSDLRAQETGVSIPKQKYASSAEASYPFSSIPLLNTVVTLDSSSFVNYDGTRKTTLEAALYNNRGNLLGTLALPFGIADLTAIQKVEDAPSVMSLMANIAAYGNVGGADTEYGLANAASDGIMNSALSFLEKLGGETGIVKAILMPTEDPTRYDAYLWTGINTMKLEDLEYDRNGISLEPNYIGQDYDSLLGEVNDTFTLSDFQAMADGSFFEERSDLYGAVANGVIGLPIMLQLEGWLTTEIRYNFDKGEWEVLTTGGGFTAGVQMEFEKNLNLSVYGIPLTAGFVVRGGVVVDFETAVRYAEQLGLDWNDETADRVNDYLTSLRISAYFEFFGGIGHDKGFTAKIGLFGKIEINNENMFLTRKYLKNPSDKDMAGQFLQLDGEAGIKAALGVGPLVTEITLVSLGFGDAWRYNEWNDIDKYWEEASSGLGSTGWLYTDEGVQSTALSFNALGASLMSEPVAKLQSRDYLEEGDRVWLGGDSGISLMSLDDNNKLNAIQTNSYPFCTPMVSDDGGMLVYLSDADSTDVTDVEVRYSLSDGGSFPEGSAIPVGTDGFSGYGDSSLDFDGTRDFAGAVWLREATTVGLKAGSVLNESQQAALLGGLEVVASIWDGENWATTRLTENGSQEFEPVIAVSGDKAIAAWRSVQTDENAYDFSENRILCKIYDKATGWSNETYTLYNGSAGEVTGMTAEMLADGTAAIAFSIEDEKGSEIYYTVADTNAANIEDDAKTIRATTNAYVDKDPQLTTVGDQFVLGWSSVQSLTGVEQHDIGLRVFDNTGAPKALLPESLSDMVSTANFDGQFTFVKGADSFDKLVILWNDANTGSEENDVIRGIKFVSYDNSYISSAAIEVAELPARSRLDHMEAFDFSNSYYTCVQAVIQCTEYSEIDKADPSTYDKVSYAYEMDGEEYTGTGYIPKETVNLVSATQNFKDAVEVVATTVDYNTLATNSYVPINFTVENRGVHVMNKVWIAVAGGNSIFQEYSGFEILPGQSKTFSYVVKTGDVIEDLKYSVQGVFVGAISGDNPFKAGTVYLDYPDIGISALTVTKEQDGLRTVLANLYNQSAASLNKDNRRVVLGVYSDPECVTPLDGKYFEDGTETEGYELILTGDKLADIDSFGYTQKFTFDIGEYVKDAELDEIPDGGVMLFVKTRIEQKVNDEWITLPEADGQNNQKHLTFDSLLTRSENAPTTLSVEMENGSTTTAIVQVRNNSLQSRTSGNLVAALLDSSGKLLETKNVGDLTLAPEAVQKSAIAFSTSGARVVLRYGEAAADSGSSSNANAASITIDGLPLTIGSFNEKDSATVENVSSGRYLLTVIPKGDGAAVTVNGELAENGMAEIVGGAYTRTVTVTITAADGAATRTYTIYLNPAPSSDSDDYTLRFETNGGSEITALRKSYGTTVDLTDYTPARGGYIFTGWYADKALTEKITKVTLTGSTTVYAGWQEAADSPLTDVPANAYYADAVDWAVGEGVTNGTSETTFSPNATCTRAQAVTFLWRAAGSPAPKTSEMPFTDVAEGSYYYDAVLWAVENGITNGTSDTTFSPNAECTRAQIVTFLWRSQESPDAGTVNPFTDVADDAYYADAVLWAVGEGITNGTSSTTFSPADNCTRAQIVTFLYRCLAEE